MKAACQHTSNNLKRNNHEKDFIRIDRIDNDQLAGAAEIVFNQRMLSQFQFFLLSGLILISLPAFTAVREDSRAVTAKIGIVIPTLEFNTKSPETTAKTLTYKPNAPSKTVLSVAYQWLGLSVGSINPVTTDRESEYGTTKATDYQFRFYFRNFSAEAFYQNYKGYFIDNTQDVDSNWISGQQRRLYPDLSTSHQGFSLTYAFNPENYSMAAAFDHSSRQTASGGSWLANISISQHLFSNAQVLTPAELAPTYGEFAEIQSGTLTSFTVGAGGAYTLVAADSFFFSLMGIVNFGQNLKKYEKTDGTTTNETAPGSQIHAKFSLGYNAENFLSGFTFASDSTNYTLEKIELNFQTLEAGLFVGTRF